MEKENHTNLNTYPGAIFVQPWWLDAVAPGRWGEICVKRDVTLFARMPYYIKKKFGYTALTMPPLTQTLGPWLREYPGKYANRISEEIDLMNELMDKLPKHDYFVQNFEYTISNWLPFYWRGFQQTTRYTYVIEDLSDTEFLWGEMRSNVRGPIRKASELLTVRDDLDVEELLLLNKKTFNRQGLEPPYPDDLVRRIVEACQSRNCGKMFFAEDSKRLIHGAMLLVWDDKQAYGILSGSDPEFRESGVSLFLLWEAIKYSTKVSESFNFCGSMMKQIETVFRGFGSIQKRYFQITKTNSLGIKFLQDISSLKRIATKSNRHI